MEDNNTTPKNIAPQKKQKRRRRRYIDPVYTKFQKEVVKSIHSMEFYDFFLDAMEHGSKEYQFSNRKIEKSVDETWVNAIDACMTAFQNIINNPRNFIIEEEEIVNVMVAKKADGDVIKHLTTHGKYIDSVSEDNVRPNHLMNKFKEDTYNTYENRFVYTLLEKTLEFVQKRYEGIFANMGDEFGAFLKVEADVNCNTDSLTTDFDIRLRQKTDELSDSKKVEDVFARIVRIYKTLQQMNETAFAKNVRKFPRVKHPIVKTNAIQKNPNFKACYKLWNFIYMYKDIGYDINIIEQDATIDSDFEEDILHVILFQYMILKNHLADDKDREIDTERNFRKKTLKPRYIKQIVEDIIKNYDIPDVETRKVLIEEITKAQLMQQEEKERRRIQAQYEREQAAKRREEARQKAEEQRRLMAERAKLIKEQEKVRLKLKRDQEKLDNQNEHRVERIRLELDRFSEEMQNLDRRRAEEAAKAAAKAEEEKNKPTLTPEEKAEQEAQKRAAAAKKARETRLYNKMKKEADSERRKKQRLNAEKERREKLLEEEKQKKAEREAEEAAAEARRLEAERVREQMEIERAKAEEAALLAEAEEAARAVEEQVKASESMADDAVAAELQIEDTPIAEEYKAEPEENPHREGVVERVRNIFTRR